MKILFTGRSRAETKRKALAYWVDNQHTLGLGMRAFFERCALSADGTTLVFRHETAKPSPGRGLLARLRR